MYNKNRIDALFKEYIFTKNLEILEDLLEELSSMIDVVLSRWPQHKSFWDDCKSEIKLRLWRNLQNQNIDRTRQTINPSAYLFFLLRTMATRVLTRIPDTQMLSLDSILNQHS